MSWMLMRGEWGLASGRAHDQLDRMTSDPGQVRLKLMAAAVHLLTASGAVLGLLALAAAARQDWARAFLWLGIALIVDGIDGPLARRFHVETMLPRFSGARLDLVIDYLNYCVVPAFMLATADLIPQPLALVAGALVILTSLFHFADRKSKTADAYFVGFPAIWNVVALYLFALDLRGLAAFAVVVILSALTLIPIKWPHPLRVLTARPMTIAVMTAWAIAALVALGGFPAPLWVKGVFLAAAIYMLALVVARTMLGAGRGDATDKTQ